MTAPVGQARQIDPKWGWIAIVVAAVIGTTTIFVSSSVIHRRDRLAIVTWEQVSYTKVLRAEQIHGLLTDLERRIATASRGDRGIKGLRAEVQAARTEVQRIKRALESSRTPEIMLMSAEHTFSAVGLTLEAVTWLEREIAAIPVPDDVREQFRAAWTRADERFERGGRALRDVRCRARVPACEALPVL